MIIDKFSPRGGKYVLERRRAVPAGASSQIREIAPDGVDAVAHLAGDPSAVALIRGAGRFVSTLVQSPDPVPTQTTSEVSVYPDPTREILDELAHAAFLAS